MRQSGPRVLPDLRCLDPCYLVLNHLAAREGSTAAWIDTTGDFSVEVAQDVLATKQA